MTEKKISPYATNHSPMRVDIARVIGKKQLTTTEIAAKFEGYSRERMANILRGMVESKILSRETTPEGRVLWFKYKAAPKPQERETPCWNGTMREKLTMGYMTQPAPRSEGIDPRSVQSRGF